MTTFSRENFFLGVALALALASAVVFGGLAWRNTRLPRGAVAHVPLSSESYAPSVAETVPVKTDTWNQPGPQSRGREWVYDTFTPPEIYYSPRARHFTVKPPTGAADEVPEEPFGLELVSVRPEPFRLQLIGYVGGEGNWRGTFENEISGEVFLAGAGRRVPDLALSIVGLDVSAAPVKLPDSMTTRQRLATAVVRDERTGHEVTLTHRERRLTGGLTALVAPPGDAAPREVRQGDTFKLGEASYRVEKIQLAPPGAEVTKESPSLAQPDRRRLTPRESDDTPPPAPAPAS